MPEAAPLADLTGTVALVIGGTRNVGAAFAEHLAARGATTVITYSGDDAAAEKTPARLAEYGGTAEAIRSDATVPADVAALFEGVVGRHGRMDIVVHVPGAAIKKPLADLTDEDARSSCWMRPETACRARCRLCAARVTLCSPATARNDRRVAGRARP
jgi:NAD(P)-dependent dehydrogenase (short-subunit alcohol dehydrogenase family)